MPIKVKVLPWRLRAELKKPLGILLKAGSEAAKLAARENPPLIVAVGDLTSKVLADTGVKVSIYLIDGKVERKPLESLSLPAETLLRVRNPSGTVSFEAVEALKKALTSGKITLIMVDGEEDLLTLVALAYAPDGALVFYGQPGEGLVAVKVNGEKRKYALSILSMMVEAEV
jgi:hypothetical protein